MDPITHGIVGAALVAVAGGEVNLGNPLLIAAVLGAVAPDLDIVYQYWGDQVYLKHHRGFSHSLPGLLGFSAVIGGCLSLIFPHFAFGAIFLWAFLGALSHSFLDLLNSYGVMLFYPFSRKKYTLNLLMISDPFLLLGSGILIYYGYYGVKLYVYLALTLVITYLFMRLMMRRRAEKEIRNYYGGYLEKIVVMPAFIGIVKWDFIVTVSKKNIVGQINILTNKISIHKKLKLISEEIKEELEQTKIGKIFKEFTPFCHIDYYIEDNKLIGRFTDLRYFVKNRFLHHATVIVDKNDFQVEKAMFQPYHPKNSIEII